MGLPSGTGRSGQRTSNGSAGERVKVRPSTLMKSLPPGSLDSGASDGPLPRGRSGIQSRGRDSGWTGEWRPVFEKQV